MTYQKSITVYLNWPEYNVKKFLPWQNVSDIKYIELTEGRTVICFDDISRDWQELSQVIWGNISLIVLFYALKYQGFQTLLIAQHEIAPKIKLSAMNIKHNDTQPIIAGKLQCFRFRDNEETAMLVPNKMVAT